MRRILVPLAVAALAAGVAEAAFSSVPVTMRTPGAERFDLQGGNGRAVVTGKGALNIQIGRGGLRIVDLADRGRPNISDSCRERSHRVSPRTIEILGRDIRCLVWSGDNGAKWQAIMRGRGINAGGTVRGSVTLDGADTGRTGRFRRGDGGWRLWPRTVDTYPLSSA